MNKSWFVVVVAGLLAGAIHADPPPSTTPPQGLRQNTPQAHAIAHARIVTAPGKMIENGTIVIRDGVIEAVGTNVTAPPDARVWDLAGKTIYPGLIEAYSELPADAVKNDPATTSGAKYWNSAVTPELSVARLYKPDNGLSGSFRAQGITARLVAPPSGIVKGTSALVSCGDEDAQHAILKDVVALHAKLEPVGSEDDAYPNSPMGALALVRQVFYDAQWYRAAQAAWNKDRALPRPEENAALAALVAQTNNKLPVIIDAPDDLYAMRADRIGREFKLTTIIHGSGEEYRRADQIAKTQRPVIVPVNFPKPPLVGSPELANAVSLEDLMDWDLAPENAMRLDRAGVKFAFTSDGLKDRGSFLTNIRKAVARGLSKDSALRALTQTPAELLGVSSRIGTIEPGKLADFVVADGDLFAEKTKVLQTWVDGTRYEILPAPIVEPRGQWKLMIGEQTFTIDIKGEPAKLSGKLTKPSATSQSSTTTTTPATTQATSKPADVDLNNLKLSDALVSFTIKGESIGGEGVVQVSGTIIDDAWTGAALINGERTPVTATRAKPYTPEKDAPATLPAATTAPVVEPTGTVNPPTEQGGGTTKVVVPATGPTAVAEAKPSATKPTSAPSTQAALYPVNYPFGDFGRVAIPAQPKAVLFTHATIWTCSPQGILQDASILIENGKITGIGGKILNVPEGAIEIDCTGKHITPGIIDCHSHIATDGGINESGQAITAEVRISDFIDPTDINIYRQLAGGVTTSHILHGSANPIGGQDQVIKLRWGATSEEMKFAGAPAGIKFALGENVKQSNWGEKYTNRYPQSRMGVAQLIRDEFKAAMDYHRKQVIYDADPTGIPPRRDLELDAIVEILQGKRMIHCHCYRQDEILALMRVCEEFKIHVGNFHHVLEGYKIADEILKHGAGVTTFSDWFGYKVEANDAIPYNGAMMYSAGLVVSFNSDDPEMARRLNLEAVKAVKYGGVPQVEAMKFVTLNPARQLGIEKQVGSLEAGKDGDLVVWSESPLSNFTSCEETWIDGRKYFDRSEDNTMRDEQKKMRAKLIERILQSGEPMAEPEDSPPGKKMWTREDLFCEHSAEGGR
jgi:N-acetylglucosamine-6-phosphate deacetylase